jgi:hypothetical protein
MPHGIAVTFDGLHSIGRLWTATDQLQTEVEINLNLAILGFHQEPHPIAVFTDGALILRFASVIKRAGPPNEESKKDYGEENGCTIGHEKSDGHSVFQGCLHVEDPPETRSREDLTILL